MIMDFFFAGLGILILFLAGDLLVQGAVNLAIRLRIPALIISLTVVAFGTSAPELLVAIQAVSDGFPDLALGNVVGSNIANVLLILGLPALAFTLAEGGESHRSYITMVGATVLFIALAFTGTLTRLHGAILLSALALVLLDMAREARRHRNEGDYGDLPEEADPDMPGWRIALYIALGLVGLPIGAEFLIDGSISMARAFGVTEAVIGLTLVAIGTSLPELATTVMAARRGRGDVALGNVIGSNIFNFLAIIGIAAIFTPIPVGETFLRLDLWVALAASLALAPFVFARRGFSRGTGAMFLIVFGTYLWLLLI